MKCSEVPIMQYSHAKNSDFVSASVEARCLDGGSFLV